MTINVYQPHQAKSKMAKAKGKDRRVGLTSLGAGRVLNILDQRPWEEGRGHAWLAAGQSSRITPEQGLGLAHVVRGGGLHGCSLLLLVPLA